MAAIQIVEVGPRDGLQNERAVLVTETKVELIERLSNAGATRIEAVSFAHPRYVPQMADAEAVMERLTKHPGVSYIGLVLNERGLARALSTDLDEINFSLSSTEGFNQANLATGVEDTVSFIVSALDGLHHKTTATISVVWGCPFEGEVDERRVIELAARLAEAGIDEVALADTIGVADPWRVQSMIEAVKPVIGSAALRVHFHDTRSTGIANAFAAVQAGVTILDSSVGGLGGCPFAPEATGNIATNDLVYMLERAGHETGLDLGRLNAITSWIGDELGTEPPSMVARAGGFPQPGRPG